MFDEFNRIKIVYPKDYLNKDRIQYTLEKLFDNALEHRFNCNDSHRDGCVEFSNEDYIIFEKEFLKSYRIILNLNDQNFEQYIQWKSSLIKFHYFFESNNMIVWSNIPEEYGLSCVYTFIRVDTFLDGYNLAGTYDSYGSLSHDGYKSCNNYTIDLSLIIPNSLHIYIPQLNYLYSIKNIYEQYYFHIIRNKEGLKINTKFNDEFCHVKFVGINEMLQFEYSNRNEIITKDNPFKCDSTIALPPNTTVGLYLQLVGFPSVFYIDLLYSILTIIE